jgi:predicted nucleic acid-binding protein
VVSGGARVILLDTSVLIGSLTGDQRLAPSLRRAIEEGERLLLPSIVLYDWLRGARSRQEIALQEAVVPSESAIPYGYAEAALSARLYRSLRRPRGREIDLAIAACALTRDASLWTSNRKDFEDIPKLQLYVAA